MSTLHVESIYGFYHGQDPRTFTPDFESCTDKEIAAWKQACTDAEAGTWVQDHSGCYYSTDESGEIQTLITKTSMGVGVYSVVFTDEGEFVRDATFADLERQSEWEEEVQGHEVAGKCCMEGYGPFITGILERELKPLLEAGQAMREYIGDGNYPTFRTLKVNWDAALASGERPAERGKG